MGVSTPFVSIIIPYYKNTDTISRAIESVYKQTISDWELIIVDDGSKDGLDRLLKKYSRENLTFIQKNNTGPSDSRNVGVAASSGSYLAFLDSDDWLAPDWLEQFKRIHEESEFEIAYCFGALIDENTHQREDWKKFASMNIEGEPVKFNNLVGTFLVERILFEKAGGFDPQLRYSENMDIAIRMMQKGNPEKRIYLDKVLVFFGNTLDPRKRNEKYARSLMLKDLGYFQEKHLQMLRENPSFLRAIIRRQLVSATVCWNWKRYLRKLRELYSYSLRDGAKYTLLLFLLPINRIRLISLGFRK